MKEYKVVYNHKGYTIEAGQNGWIPSKEIAEKILTHHQNRPIFFDTLLYLEERERTEPIDKKDCRSYCGKIVYNEDWLYFDALQIGDYVENEIVTNLMDCLPPACMRSDCSQLGEPSSSKIDYDGRCKNVYATFKCVTSGSNSIWEYCGNCFRGENVERGKEIPYV